MGLEVKMLSRLLKSTFSVGRGWGCGLVLVKILIAHGVLMALICLNDVTTTLTLYSPLWLFKMTSVAFPLASSRDDSMSRGVVWVGVGVFIQRLNQT